MFTRLRSLFSSVIRPHLEVVTDAPHRVEPGRPVPLVCMIRDPRKQSVKIESIRVEIKKDGRILRSASVLKKPQSVQHGQWHKVILIPLPDNLVGYFEIETYFTVALHSKVYSVRNNTVRKDGRKPLSVYRARESLPRFREYCFGDLHYHRHHSRHGLEFSNSLPVSAEMAKALGLQFFASTDHSHIIERGWGYGSDGGQETWEAFKAEIESWNRNNELIILPGEEVSCKNVKGRDVSLVIINYPEFIRGARLQREKSAQEPSEQNLKDIMSRVGSAAVTFAVNPVKRLPLVKRFMSGKGSWSKFDLTLTGLTGMQIHDGPNQFFLEEGLSQWVSVLLKGRRKYIVTGSDVPAHRDRKDEKHFIPFGSRYTFGGARTGIFCTQPITREKIIDSLRRGVSAITNGPLMDFAVRNETGERSLLGGEIRGSFFTVKYRGISTPEYGAVTNLKIYAGDISAGVESLVYTISYHGDIFSIEGEFNVEPLSSEGYLRGELLSRRNNRQLFCYTNPIWFRSVKN